MSLIWASLIFGILMNNIIKLSYYENNNVLFSSLMRVFWDFEIFFQIWERPALQDPSILPCNVAIISELIKVNVVLRSTKLLEITGLSQSPENHELFVFKTWYSFEIIRTSLFNEYLP